VVTPGNNVKTLSGRVRLHWRTGKLLVSSPGTQRNADLFVRQPGRICDAALRCYRCIHVICDNAKFHDCGRVRSSSPAWGHRIVIHFLPTYAPKRTLSNGVRGICTKKLPATNRCKTIEELVQLTFDWFGYKSTFRHRGLPLTRRLWPL